ncbi:ATP-binding protein, partial [Limosilactobacillus mucosae]|nr:ATP-binding protein [Limosilactobacillus mucosae]
MSTTTQNSASQRRRVHYVFNNQEVPRLTIRQLFDTRRFSRLTAVTGELDADFFNQHLSDLIQVEIALGAQEQVTPQTADEAATKGALT